MTDEATPRPPTPPIVHILRLLLVPAVLLVAFLGVVAGALITDACPSSIGCGGVEALAVGHVPMQVAIGATGLVASFRLWEPRARLLALLAALAASPVAAIAFHAIVVAYMNRLPGTG